MMILNLEEEVTSFFRVYLRWSREKKRKTKVKEFTKNQLLHFKQLRKEQKNRRKNGKKGLVEQPEVEETRWLVPANDTYQSGEKKRKLEDEDECLARGKRMVKASLKEGKKIGKPQENGEAAPMAFRRDAIPTTSKPKRTGSSHLKEINSVNLNERTTAGRSIGSGTFGTCYPDKYTGIPVVIKEYKETSCRGGGDLSFLQKQAKYKANVLLQLGDHRGIPLFSGACLEKSPSAL